MNYFEIGKIVNAHGIKGEVRVVPSTDDPERFELLDTIDLFFKEGGEPHQYVLENSWPHKSLVVLKLAKINDRNAAEKLIGAVIKIPPEKALPLEEDEYYQRDLLDMTVITDTGEELGTLVQILVTGANDVYVVRPKDAADYKHDILIPAIKECILDISLAENQMTVHLMKGLR